MFPILFLQTDCFKIFNFGYFVKVKYLWSGIKNIFIKSIKARNLGKEEKFFLLLDNAPCHPSADKLNDVDPQFTVQYLPPNVTSVVQPLDQGVIVCMKKNYKKIFLR